MDGGFRFEAVMVSKVAEERIDEFRPDDDLAHVVLKNPGGPPSEVCKRVLMAANQSLQMHGAGELRVTGASSMMKNTRIEVPSSR